MVKFLFGLSVFLCANLYAQTISVGASTDTSDYLIGDYIHYQIKVIAKKDIHLIQPFLPDTLTQLELISTGKPKTSEEGDSKTIIYPFTLAGYDSITAIIPAVPVMYRENQDTLLHKIETDPIIVNIHTVPISTAEEIKDVKSPLSIPFDWKWLLFWIVIAVIVILVGRYFYKRYQAKKAGIPIETKIIRIPAHVKALTALENLANEQLWQKGKIKEYHSKITEIIRIYFEERFELPAMELTTSESMQKLGQIKAAENILGITSDFLSNADLVKFAKFQPLESVNEEMMKQANKIVNKTIPQEPVVVEQEEEVNV
ncbi:MAG: hypothetical protein P8Y79_06505 [Ignavibacteriaceae bacterium]